MLWYRDNVLLNNSVSGEGTEKLLTISSAAFEDRGEYACRAINRVGVAEKIAILDVFSKLHW